MPRSARQADLPFRTWGGARAGAGRPPKRDKAGVQHLPRPVVTRHQPLHVTLRVQKSIPSLRSAALFPTVRAALAAGRERFGFRLVHFSVQCDHLHLIVEANDRRALARGVQGIAVRIAKAVNRSIERKGKLFTDRYHAHVLKTPVEVRYALRYVLMNVRKHALGMRDAPRKSSRLTVRGASGMRDAPRKSSRLTVRGASGMRDAPPMGFVDTCSSAAWFPHFARPSELQFGAERCRAAWAKQSGSSEPPVALARSWLLRVGHRSAGGIDVDEVPGRSK